MKMRNSVVSVAASVALLFGGSAAVAAKPVAGSATAVRAATPVKSAEKIKGNGWLVPLVIVASVTGGVIVVAKHNPTKPSSP